MAAARPALRPDLQASFASIRLTLAYLLASVLRETEHGKQLLLTPERSLPHLLPAIQSAVGRLLADLADSVNFYVDEQSDANPDFDAKVAFKSRAGVRALHADVLQTTRRHARRDATFLFDLPPVR